MDDLKTLFSDAKISEAIDELLNLQSHGKRAFLIGAGCSKCADLPLMDELTGKLLANFPDGNSKAILGTIVDKFGKAGKPNIEDYMSELVDHIAICERRNKGSTGKPVKIELGKGTFDSQELRTALLDIKKGISDIILEKDQNISWHRRFIAAIHGPLGPAVRPKTPPVDYFVLNYDTLIEDALGAERRCFVDGFSGGVTAWWDAHCFNAEQIGSMNTEARVFKVHGSIDWCILETDELPRRIRPNCGSVAPEEPVLIWPASTKYAETQRDPYAQVMAYMRNTFEARFGAETILIVNGYSFNDSHINSEIINGLYRSSGRLTLVALVSDDNPNLVLKKLLADKAIGKQVRVFANKGFYHGDTKYEKTDSLCWWKFENFVRLLEGEKA